MFRNFSPGVQIFSLVVAKTLSLFKAPKKSTKPIPTAAPNTYSQMIRKVVAAHADCTAEVFNIFVSGAGKVRIFSELTPGDRVELKLINGEVSVYADGKFMSTPLLPDSSRLRSLLESYEEVEAYLGGRDVISCTDDAEFASIIAFYKIKGVPPTPVSIQ